MVAKIFWLRMQTISFVFLCDTDDDGTRGLQDWCETFPLYRGKQGEDEEDSSERVQGKFKVSGQHALLRKYITQVIVLVCLKIDSVLMLSVAGQVLCVSSG